MNPDIKTEWVRRLRSGEYDQGSYYLRRDGQYCCLGVLCEIAATVGVVAQVTETETDQGADGWLFDGAIAGLPASVREWSGISSGLAMYGDAPSGRTQGYCHSHSLAEDNDKGLTFIEIADIIEREF